MTHTTNTSITVSVLSAEEDQTVAAEYFVFEEGWILFKTYDHKVTAAYPERDVLRILQGAGGGGE